MLASLVRVGVWSRESFLANLLKAPRLLLPSIIPVLYPWEGTGTLDFFVSNPEVMFMYVKVFILFNVCRECCYVLQ